MRVLIAEDDILLTKLMDTLVRRVSGCEVITATGKIADVLRQIDEISTIPQIVVRFIETSNDPDASMEDLQEIVKCDPAMASRILRLVNSSAFGVRSRITNLQQAIGYLGIKQVRNLVVAISVSNLFRTHGCLENYERIKLWKHMVSVAICSRLIANMSRAPDAEEYFLAGLLHDVGIVLEDQFIHQPFCRLIKSLDEERTLSECEHDWFHFDHAMLGEAVARQWLFPEAVCAAIRHHHQSEAYSGEDALIVRTVELANSVCSQMGITSVGVNLVRDVTPAKLDIPMSAEALRELISQLQEEIHRAAGLIEL